MSVLLFINYNTKIAIILKISDPDPADLVWYRYGIASKRWVLFLILLDVGVRASISGW